MTGAFPNPGDLFEERYRVGAIIGTGGFARVYIARDQELGREVALKILTPSEDGYDAKLVERFAQEARLVSRLRDPNTITMFDYGNAVSGLLYMVFEYINGMSLSKLVHTEGALAPSRVKKILQQTLSSLEEAHSLGVMHRDIKPGNIMVFEHVGRKDQAKLLDFGIAKLTTATKTLKGDLTADGALIGTPRYMSPEQIRGEKITPQSDIYSLGLVAYEMLVGQKAISSNSSVTIIGQQLDPTPFFVPPIAEVPESFRQIVNRMMAKDADVRFQTATEVLIALENWEAPPASQSSNGSDEDLVSTSVLRSSDSLPMASVSPVPLTDISEQVIPLSPHETGSHSSAPRTPALDQTAAPVAGAVPVPVPVPVRSPVPAMAPASTSQPIPLMQPPSSGFQDPPSPQRPQTLPPQSMSSSELLQQYRADPSVIIVADDGSKKTMFLLGGAILLLLLMIGGFMAYNATKSDPAPVVPAEPPVAVAPPVAPVEAEKVDDKPAAAARRMMVRTVPTGLAVTINGRPMGNTPVMLVEDTVKFPLAVRVLSGKKDKVVKLEAYQADLLIDAEDLMPEVAVAEKPEEAVAKEPEPVEKPKVVKKKKTPKKVTKKKPDLKKEDTSDDSFSIPALDL